MLRTLATPIRFWFQLKLWVRILVALVLGTIFGYFIGPRHVAYLKPVGEIFLNLIRMLVVPLVFSSMTVGVVSIRDPKKLGRVGIKTLFLYTITTVIAVVIALSVAYIINPGKGVVLVSDIDMSSIELQSQMSLKDTILSIIPTNPIAALAEANVLQVIVCAVLLGITIALTGEKGKPLQDFFTSLSEVMFRMIGIIMEFAPFGVFAMMAWVSGSFGFDVLKSLMKFLLCNYIAIIIQVVFIYGGILLFIGRLNPIPFFSGMKSAMAFAFSTNSSSATLPVSMHCVQNNLGVSRGVTSFILPLGSTVNMDGAAIFQAITAVFIAQSYGIDLSWMELGTIIVTAILSAVGAAGIPGSSLVMISVVLGAIGLPLEGVMIIAGVDRIREMGSAVTNILGDAVVAVCVAKTEGELDEGQYNHTELVDFEESEL